jgi:hypothetical protein
MTSRERAIEMAEKEMETVERYTREGLPSCYSDFESYLYDFYPSLPWDDAVSISLEHILKSGKFEATLDAVQQRFGFDFRAELRCSLEQS